MTFLDYNINQLLFTILMSFRIGAFFMSFPPIADYNVPVIVRVILPMAMAILLAPVVPNVLAPNLGSDVVVFFYAIMTEILAGLVMGFSVHILFALASIAGEFAGMEVGFSMGSMFDPSFGQASLLAALLRILVVLMFFMTDMHHKFIWVLVQSYQALPPGTHFFPLTQVIMGYLTLFKNIFLLAIHFALPLVVTIFLSHVMVGIVSITAPQMNIYFNVSVALNVLIGMAIVALSIGLLFGYFQRGGQFLAEFLTHHFAVP